MSLKDRTVPSRSPIGSSCTLPAGLSRSKSFGGLLAHKRSSSGTVLREPEVGRGSWSGGYVLGQAYCSPGGTRKYLGLSSKAKIPKCPRPQRTFDVAEAVSRGLRECVAVTEEDITGFRTTLDNLSVNSQQSQGKVYELEKQLRGAERHLKKLEYQLSKLDELLEQYGLQQKLRDGVRTMAYAYVLSPGKEKESALHRVRSGYRECTDVLCALEAQLEQMMGTMQFQMKGIQGFARLCQGDVFEITMKHGNQKWRSRGRINKDGQQTWDNPRTLFKGLLGEVLFIKAVEVKMLGKQVLLGNKFCETRDLFCAHPQLMTVNLNPSGSLKLSVIVTWNPIDGVEEVVSLRAGSNSGSPGNRRRSSPSPSTTLQSVIVESVTVGNMLQPLSYGSDSMLSPDHDSGQSSSAKSSTADSASPLSEYRNMLNNHNNASDDLYTKSLRNSMRTDSSDSIDRGSNDSMRENSPQRLLSGNGIEYTDPTGNFTTRQRDDFKSPAINKRYSLHAPPPTQAFYQQTSTSTSMNERPRTVDFSYMFKENSDDHINPHVGNDIGLTRWCGWRDHDDMSLRDVVHRLSSCLEDIQGQYPELHAMEVHVLELEEIIRCSRSRRNSEGSDISLSVESALECFDFLNTETDEDIEYADGEGSNREAKARADLAMTTRTNDSGIASMGRQFSEDRDLNTTPPPSFGLVTGNPQLDLTLLTHLNYCQRLVENLGSFGPLRCRETRALEKLQKQSKVVGKILRHAKKEKKNKLTGFGELVSHPQLQMLWDKVTEQGKKLCVPADEVLQGLEPECRNLLKDKPPGFSFQVTKMLIQELLDLPSYDPASICTVYQFLLFLRSQEQSFPKKVEDIAEEVAIVQSLQSKNTITIGDTLSQMVHILPPHNAIINIAQLLVRSKELGDTAKKYFNHLNGVSSLRQEIVNVLTETLESPNAVERQAACRALLILNGNESIPQLSYILQADDSSVVRSDAKETLLSFGNEGVDAVQQFELSSHGFQGLTMK